MKKEYFITTLFLIGLWYLGAYFVQNDILIPFPHDVLMNVVRILGDLSQYQAIIYTIWRVTVGFLISFVLALLCSIFAYEYESINRLFTPILLITKTIPNVSYIILCLIWFGSEGAVSVVSFMILFPVFYSSFFQTLENESQSLKDVDAIYNTSLWDKIIHRILPSLYLTMLSTGKTAYSLGFKVGVMAEILGQVRLGIGKQLYYAKINLDTTNLLAWTIIIIIISIIFELIFNYSLQLRVKEEQIWKD